MFSKAAGTKPAAALSPGWEQRPPQSSDVTLQEEPGAHRARFKDQPDRLVPPFTSIGIRDTLSTCQAEGGATNRVPTLGQGWQIPDPQRREENGPQGLVSLSQ